MEKRPRGLNPTQGPTGKLGMLKVGKCSSPRKNTQYQMVSPENMQASSIAQTEWVIFLHMHAHTHTHTHLYLEESKEECIGESEGRKGKG